MRALPLALSALLLTGCTATEPPAATPTAPPRTYLALGDSVAAGVGAASRAAGYPALLRARLEQECLCEVRLEDLAVSGATTASVLRDQLPRAREVLAQGDVALVTLTVGGNDVFGPVVAACFADPTAASCRSAAVQAVAAADRGLDHVLEQLAAGGATVAVMAYYDPLPGCRLAALSPLAQQVLEGTGDQQGLNDVVRARAAEHGAVVVETADAVRAPDGLVGGDDCLHPSGSGHAAIAAAFAQAVSLIQPWRSARATAVQFQDITRQAVEHVSAGVQALAEQADALRAALSGEGRLDELDALDAAVAGLQDRYVMARQREVHEQVTGGGVVAIELL